MSINYPDNVKHNNDNFPIIKASDATIQGWFHVASTAARDALASNKRQEGAVAVVGQVAYLYKSADLGDPAWQNASNWEEIGATVDLSTTSIDALQDVDTTTSAPTNGQVLKWNGSAWAPADDLTGGGGVAQDLSYNGTTHAIDISDGGTSAIIPIATTGQEGLMSNTDKAKLDGIEAGATADQTAGEIKTAYESNANTNAFTDAEQTKLAGIAAGAEVNVNADWNAVSGDAQILNKPTLYTSSDFDTDFAAKTVSELSDIPAEPTGAGLTKLLQWDGAAWGYIDTPVPGGGGITALDQASDTLFSGLTADDFMIWDTTGGGDWINVTPADVRSTLFGTGFAGQYLGWNGSDWVAGTVDYNDLVNTPTLATVALTGEYGDLGSQPIFAAGSDITITPVTVGGQTTYTFDVTASGTITSVNGDSGPAVSLSVQDLDNTQASYSNGQYLKWDSNAGEWQGAFPLEATSSVHNLSDVATYSNPLSAVGHMLYQSSTDTSNPTWSTMLLVTSPTTGQFLKWNGTSPEWADTTLLGLSEVPAPPNNNDSAVYALTLTDAATDTWAWVDTGAWSGSGGITDTPNDGNTYIRQFGSWTAFDPADKANTSHVHAAADVTSGTFDLARIPTITTAKISDIPTPAFPNALKLIRINAGGTGYELYDLDYGDISNTPTLGSAAALNVPLAGNDASGTQVVRGDDTRLTDARTPTAHTHVKADITDFSDGDYAAASHTHAAADVTSGTFDVARIPTLTTSKISDIPNPVPGINANKLIRINSGGTSYEVYDLDYGDIANTPVFGTAAFLNVPLSGNDAGTTQVVRGDDTRLTDARTPTAHTHTLSEITDAGTAAASDVGDFAAASHTHTLSQITDSGTSAALNVAASGDAASGEVVKGDDTRLTDARTPTAHTHVIADVTGLQTALDGKAATSHTHAISDVTGLQTALDGKASTSHTHTTADITDIPSPTGTVGHVLAVNSAQNAYELVAPSSGGIADKGDAVTALRKNGAWVDFPIDEGMLPGVSNTGLVWDSGNSRWTASVTPVALTGDVTWSGLPIVGNQDSNIGELYIWNSTFAGILGLPTLAAGQVLKYTANADGAANPGWVQADVTDTVSVVVESPSIKSYKIVLKMPHAGNVTEVVAITTSGSCDFNVQFEGVNVHGSEITASNTETSVTSLTGTTAFDKGDELILDVSANTTAVDLVVSVNYTVLL